MIKRVLFAFFLVLLLLPNLYGQQLLGLSSSNYSGSHAIYSNPSAIAGSRFRFSFNLFSIDGNASNNYVRYNGPNSIFKAFINKQAFDETHLEVVADNKPNLATSSMDLRGPSVMFTLGPKNSFALSSRVRGAFQVNNISDNLADLIKTSGQSDDLLNKVNKDNGFNYNGNTQAEIGLTYAREIFHTGSHYLKGGFTAKKIAGIYSSHFLNRKINFQVEERYNAADQTSEIYVNVDDIDLKLGYLSEDHLMQDFDVNKMANMLINGEAPGKGWGADIGFTYEYRPDTENMDRRKEKYKYRISAALTDLGSVRYDQAGIVKSYDLKRTNKEIRLNDFEQAQSTEDFARIINESLDIQPSDIQSSFQTGLPTALNLNVDYQVKGKVYVNATWIKGLQDQDAVSMHQPSLLAITPRFDSKGFTLALPVSMQNNYSVFAVGAMIKAGPYFIGSDNIGGAFNIGKPYGANVYTGLSISIGQTKEKVKKEKNRKKDKNANSLPIQAN